MRTARKLRRRLGAAARTFVLAAVVFAASFVLASAQRAPGRSEQVETRLSVDGCAQIATILYSECRVSRVYDCGRDADRVIVHFEFGAFVEIEERDAGVLLSRWRDADTDARERFWSLDGLVGADLLALAPGEAVDHVFGYERDDAFGVTEGDARQRFVGAGRRVLSLPSGDEPVLVLRDQTFWSDGYTMEAERQISVGLGVVVSMVVEPDENGVGARIDRRPIDILRPGSPGFEALSAGDGCLGVS